MAQRHPYILPRTPSPPLIIEPHDDSNNNCIIDIGVTTTDDAAPHTKKPPISRADAAGFLSPDSLLRVPSPNFLLPPDMASDDAHQSDGGGGSGGANGHNPFNFKTQIISTSPVKSNIGQRRGHRYKHSSISAQHQIFQEPPQRAPPVLPASLPIPTVREAWASTSREQRARAYWCLCHAAVAVYVFFSASGSLAMTALSHLVFFDVGSAAICVAVDVLGNFEVWRRSSIRHPFGLQRAEVLAGFAMSVFLVFGGFDLLSHNLKHVLEPLGSHEPHHPPLSPHAHSPGHPHSHHSSPGGGSGRHSHDGSSHHGFPRVEAGAVDPASLAAIVATLISAYGLKNHGRIRRVMRVEYPSYLSSILPGILSNPFHFLTLFFSFLMFLLPLFSVGTFVWLDRLVCAAIAVSMFVLGSRLAVAQGLMLLMSYRGRIAQQQQPPNGKAVSGVIAAAGGKDGVSAVVREIESEPHITRVEEAQFWQVHYGLCMANLKVCVAKGCDDGALSQLRSRVTRLIQNRLGEGYGRGGSLRWEVTLQMSTDPRS